MCGQKNKSSKLITELLNKIKENKNLHENISRRDMIQASIDNKNAFVCESGALATWTPVESTGRSPLDTVIVKRQESEDTIDWNSPNNIGISETTFDMILNDALELLSAKENIYLTDRAVGADPCYALPVTTVTDNALASLFTDNMFRPVPESIGKSVFSDRDFLLIALPYDKLDPVKYDGLLRKNSDGSTSDMAVAADFDRKIGVIVGSAYMGSIKKMLFTVMNYLLPFEGILPLHCSANEGDKGDSALLLGLSGTGKTTLSADPTRALLGDDEHGWGDNGIANFENGCYAKMIDIDPDKEPDIYAAVMDKKPVLEHGSIVENAMMYTDGRFDFFDDRLTPNSRASYPLTALKNIKDSSTADHPKTILFLTADAYGVLPPVSRLNTEQAMLWFLMGYTSKLAGTETGVTEPVATFSRFFGQPFMPCNPDVYASLLGDKMNSHSTKVYLINTGWTGGAYGVGSRIDITLTRKMVNAALNGDLENVEYVKDKRFHLDIPSTCPGVPSDILFPVNTWSDKDSYRMAAEKLAEQFSSAFDRAYGSNNIQDSIKGQCPGK